MRQSDEAPMDPDVLAELDAIDATLRGEAVDPAYAELAELALLVSADRPVARPGFVAELDARVGRRFCGPATVSPSVERGAGAPLRSRWTLRPAFGGLAGALIAATVVVVVLASGGTFRSGSGSAPIGSAPIGSAPLGSAPPGSAPPGSAPTVRAPGETLGTPSAKPGSTSKSAPSGVPTVTTPLTAAPYAGNPNSTSTANGPLNPATAPVAQGRKQVSAAQLQLATPSVRIEAVAQELFAVVGQVNGIVKSSNVTDTSGDGGYATFELSIPGGSLEQAMSQLSALRYAHVVSRTDQAQDVTGEHQAAVRRLADARALRTSLLKQLAAASTPTAVGSLKAQIHDAEASIATDEATLHALNDRISFSELSVQINAGPLPLPAPGADGGGGFGIGQAAHDAGRVLTVAAGVALITLAALVPIALLCALGASIAYAIRRRRREHALDAG